VVRALTSIIYLYGQNFGLSTPSTLNEYGHLWVNRTRKRGCPEGPWHPSGGFFEGIGVSSEPHRHPTPHLANTLDTP
jgi:hypothetical protein